MKKDISANFTKAVISFLFLFVSCFFSIIPEINALSKSNVYLTGTKAYLFDIDSSSGNIIDVLLRGQNFELLQTTPAGGGCSKEWFKVKHNQNIGYMCGEWASTMNLTTLNNDSQFQATLDTFPRSYWPYLINLHTAYPTAIFSPYNTNLDWTMALQKQTYDYSILSSGWISRRSLIQINKSSATSTWASQYILNLNTNNDGGGCDSTACWYAASEEAVGTYMDPRNFLNPNYIFMFESNEYDSSVQNIEGLNKILAGSFMDSSSNYYSAYALENNALYGDTLMSAAVQSGISPYVLAARIKQEIGINGSSIISGTVPNYLNLYNYYNISASGNNPVVNGLIFAANSGWNTRINAIIGGAQFIGENYKGTEYTQKWDVIGNDYVNYSDFFNKQYMQNIQAPANQTTTIYNAYLSNNNLSFPFVFSIPVYKNMPNSQTTISAAIINANYSYSDSYIGDVKNGSTVNTIKYNLKIAGENISVSVKGKDGVTDLNDSSRIGTGDILIISDGVNTETLRIVIYGDTNGDGNISAVDYVNIKNNIMGSTSLNGYYKIASDVNKDGNISAVDYVNIKNYIMGVASLIK